MNNATHGATNTLVNALAAFDLLFDLSSPSFDFESDAGE